MLILFISEGHLFKGDIAQKRFHLFAVVRERLAVKQLKNMIGRASRTLQVPDMLHRPVHLREKANHIINEKIQVSDGDKIGTPNIPDAKVKECQGQHQVVHRLCHIPTAVRVQSCHPKAVSEHGVINPAVVVVDVALSVKRLNHFNAVNVFVHAGIQHADALPVFAAEA